jgi:hypothetical protein
METPKRCCKETGKILQKQLNEMKKPLFWMEISCEEKSHPKRGFYASQEYQAHSAKTTKKGISKLEAA